MTSQDAPVASAPVAKTAAPPRGGTSSQGLHVLAWRIAASGIGLIASIVISRALGPEGRGAYALYTTTALTLAVLAKLGLEQGNVYFRASRGIAVEPLLTVSAVVAFTAGTAAVILTAWLPALLPAVFRDASPLLLVLAGAIIPFSVHQQFVAGLQTLDGAVTRQFKAATVGVVAQLALLIATAVFTHLTIFNVLLVNLAFTIVVWLATLRRSDAASMVARCDWPLLRQSIRHALVLHLGFCFLFLHLRVDFFMLKGLSSLAEVGYYSLSVMMAETVQLATDSLAIALVPRQVGNTMPEAAAVALRGARMNLLVGLVLGGAWVAVGYPLILLLFGRDFGPAYLPLVALLPGILCLGMQRVCGPVILRTGKPVLVTAIYAVSLGINVLLNLWLIPTWGAIGAAAASTLSYGLGAVLFLSWTVRLGHASPSQAVPSLGDLREFAGILNRTVRQLGKTPPSA
jgi:O-antigen/teichoic acid export membrane protein